MYKLSATHLRSRFVEGKVKATQIVEYFLARIEKYDGDVGAFLKVYRERALEKAKILDQKKANGGRLGKLAAIPIALKDNIHVDGEITTCGSKFLENYRAVFNATVTELLEAEDAIIIGKTNLDEFAMGSSTENSALQKTRNPWNLNCVPGGSSGGSTAAVAARFCPLALGSDTGGSVRQPAAFCGVTGFKPSYGRVSRYGLVAFASSLDQIGPIATNMEDMGLIMEVLGANDPRDATSALKHPEDYCSQMQGHFPGKKVGVPLEFLQDLKGEAKEHFDASIEILKKLGCEIVDVDLNILKYSVATYYIIAPAEASTNLARFDGVRYGVRSKRAKTLDEVYDFSKSEGFGIEVKKRILLGTYVLSSGYQDAYYKRATKVRMKIMEHFDQAFKQCDLIATPVSPIAAFAFGAIQDPLQMYLQDIFTIGVNLACLPAISVPCGFSQEKKPFGLQLIGARHADVLVCRLASFYEKATDFAQQIPPQFDKE